MTIYYSATTNAFYDSQVYNVNNIPEDKVAVSASTYTNLMAQQCAGRVIVAAADGTPTTIAQTCGSCTSTKYATKTELTNGLAGKANDNAVVHKSGNETINGVKSFGDIIKATNGTVQVGADTGYSVTFNYNGNITSKQARGTYNIFLPDANGTLALTSDINGKANDSDVVHRRGDETIDGTKTFTQNVTIKNNDIDLTVTPTNNIFSTIAFRDRNNTTTAALQNSQRTYGVNDICFYVYDADSNPHGFRIRTDKKLEPIENNTYSLGSPGNIWANAYIGRVVCTRFTHYINNGHIYLTGGSEWDKGATLVLNGEESSDAGAFTINSRDKTRSLYLIGRPDGTLQWAGQNIALDGNVVHRSGDETIAGNKTFSNQISFPSEYFITTDTNDNSLRIVRHGTGHGNNYKIIIQGDTGKIFAPNGFIGNLQGNVETSSLLLNSDTFKHVASPSGAHYVHTLPKFDGELLGATFVKFNNGWYRKHSDGFIEQFIYIDSTNTLSEMNVNFAIPFTTTNYHVSVIGSRTDSTDPSRTDDLIFTTCFKDKTYVNIYKFDSGENKYTTSMTVYVCGY